MKSQGSEASPSALPFVPRMTGPRLSPDDRVERGCYHPQLFHISPTKPPTGLIAVIRNRPGVATPSQGERGRDEERGGGERERRGGGEREVSSLAPCLKYFHYVALLGTGGLEWAVEYHQAKAISKQT